LKQWRVIVNPPLEDFLANEHLPSMTDPMLSRINDFYRIAYTHNREWASLVRNVMGMASNFANEQIAFVSLSMIA